MTLVELTIALAVVAVLFSMTVVGIGAITGARAKSTTNELAAVMRALYDTSSLTGKTCRIVFELPSERDEDGRVIYRAQCAEGQATMSRDRERSLRDDTEQLERAEREAKRGGSSRGERTLRSGDDEPTLEELMATEKNRVEAASRFSDFTNEEIKGKQLPPSVRIQVWTRGQREATKSGLAYVYFFPQGTAERSMVFVSQGDNAWTIKLSPLTGRAQVLADLQEIPRS